VVPAVAGHFGSGSRIFAKKTAILLAYGYPAATRWSKAFHGRQSGSEQTLKEWVQIMTPIKCKKAANSSSQYLNTPPNGNSGFGT
jgi:hypothetical protein